jgi:hypothetical protein
MVLTNEDYAELLAMYLGDGCISRGPRTMRLRITLDQKHPEVIEDAAALLRRCFPFNRVGLDTKGVTGKCVNVSVYSRHLPCLLPQHGPGSKHRRRIRLEPWQLRILARSPWPFIRGCIRTDGCCFINRTGPYEYMSYGFTNMSKEIVDLFLGACELVGVHTRVNQSRTRGTWQVRVNRRQSVALMLEHVGTKT